MITGTGFEVVGTFLLAVEAIKLSNLRFLRERVLKVAALKINPVLEFVADDNVAGALRSVIWQNSQRRIAKCWPMK
jgi:hypothetical protein